MIPAEGSGLSVKWPNLISKQINKHLKKKQIIFKQTKSFNKLTLYFCLNSELKVELIKIRLAEESAEKWALRDLRRDDDTAGRVNNRLKIKKTDGQYLLHLFRVIEKAPPTPKKWKQKGQQREMTQLWYGR